MSSSLLSAHTRSPESKQPREKIAAEENNSVPCVGVKSTRRKGGIIQAQGGLETVDWLCWPLDYS